MSADLAEFETDVDRLVQVELRRSVHSFNSLLRNLPGIYPLQVKKALGRLKVGLKPFGTFSERDTLITDLDEVDYVYPHPLDYGWRFDQRTRRGLAERASESNVRQSVALLGTPTLVEPLSHARHPVDDILLIDRDRLVLPAARGLRSRCMTLSCDLLVTTPAVDRRFGTVFMDPPWYLEHFSAFLQAAGRLCRTGGRLFASVPPVGTRPGIRQDRRRILSMANAHGFRLVGVQSRALRYDSPPFERNALAELGLSSVSRSWRSSDLFVFRRESVPSVEVPRIVAQPDKWVEFTIGSSRLRVLENVEPPLPQASMRLGVGGVLGTVSRVDPVRRRSNLLTGRNRAFRTENPSVISALLRAMEAKRCPVRAVCDTDIGVGPQLLEHAVTDLKRLIAVEDAEHSEDLHEHAALRRAL